MVSDPIGYGKKLETLGEEAARTKLAQGAYSEKSATFVKDSLNPKSEARALAEAQAKTAPIEALHLARTANNIADRANSISE